MTRQRAKLWLVVASLFALLNLGAAGVAAVAGEALHTVAHIALSLLGAYFVWRLGLLLRQHLLPSSSWREPRLERLQQALDAIGLEVERIGEAQRFTAKIVAERAHAASPKPPREAGT
jgi:hypothetical protein